MGTPDTFAIMDLDSGNALAFFDRRAEAERGFAAVLEEQPGRMHELALVGLDSEGLPVETKSATEFLQRA